MEEVPMEGYRGGEKARHKLETRGHLAGQALRHVKLDQIEYHYRDE
jgi:hypothetical protein